MMTEKGNREVETREDSVGLGAYGMDSRNCRRIVRDGLSVRQSEDLARELGAPTRKREPAHGKLRVLDPDLANLVDILRGRLQTQVRLRGSASRGRIEIDFVGADELTRIVDVILGEP